MHALNTPIIRISIMMQQMIVRDRWGRIKRYQVSTAKNGAGEQENSGCTPRGWHTVARKIGKYAPINSVFIGRKLTGEFYNDALAAKFPERDWILTRILWLKGQESGKNSGPGVDSFNRYIYIHGTPDTEPMGIPRSHGCIRMRNADVVEVFKRIALGTPVYIAQY